MSSFYFKYGVAFLVAPLLVYRIAPYSTDNEITLQLFFLRVLLYPILEELCFRGLIQNEIRRLSIFQRKFYFLSTENILTSILFGITHIVLVSPSAWIVIFPSILFGYFYEQKRNLIIPIILHSYYNAWSLFYYWY